MTLNLINFREKRSEEKAKMGIAMPEDSQR
jgi:hypothetical protein